MTDTWPPIQIHPDARIGVDNVFGPGVVVGPDIVIGSGNAFGAFVVLSGRVEIGDRNYIAPHATIGGFSRQRIRHEPSRPTSAMPRIVIGDDNLIFEQVVVHQPLNEKTEIGCRTSIGAHSHVGHDTMVGDRAILAPGALLGGFTNIGRCANIGLGATIHNRVVVGAYSMTGMNAAVTTHVRPGVKVAGLPAVCKGVNSVGLQRSDLTAPERQQLESWIENPSEVCDGVVGQLIDAWKTALAASRRDREPL